ncbi:MAG: DNA-binding response regulator [Actinobacteria bacterium HGW-Actinobacteria-7]|nr:MAG: DNA-binding response regulator [Actinobacteria bacterium HGW-Actinobacteria-7]
MPIRVVVADDHQMMREGLTLQLSSNHQYEVVAQAADGIEALEAVRTHSPDVVVMDLGMPGLNGIEATRQVLEASPGTKVIVLSGHAEEHFVSSALQAGAAGYVLKGDAFAELDQALTHVLSGGVYLSPGVQAVVVNQALGRTSSQPGLSHKELSPRELEVLRMLAEGMTAKQVAQALHLSVKTVEAHRRQVMEKTDTNSMADLVRYALREGITTLDG